MINEENYYSKECNHEYFSVSQYKDLIKCEASALAKINGNWLEDIKNINPDFEEEKTVLIVGNYCHSYFESPEAHEKFINKYEDYIYKHNRKTGEREGKYSEFKKADLLISTILKDEILMKVINGEKEYILNTQLFGYPFKGKIDILNFDLSAIIDLKFIKDFEPIYNPITKTRENFIIANGYDLQMYIYQEMYRVINNLPEGKYLNAIILAITKNGNIPDKALIEVNNNYDKEDSFYRQSILMEVKDNLPRFYNIKKGLIQPNRCDKCDWCLATKKINKIENYLAFRNPY